MKKTFEIGFVLRASTRYLVKIHINEFAMSLSVYYTFNTR